MRFIGLSLLLVIPQAALADAVVLKDGERVEGIVSERGAEVEVRVDFGTISFERAEIERIERADTALGAFERRHASLPARDAEGRYRLALEAEKGGLDSFARALFREVIERSPDHKGARAALGYRRHEGAWMTEDEYMVGQGYVRRGDGWITREAADALDRAEAERKRAEAAAERQAVESRRIDALEAEVAAAKAEACRAREEAAARATTVWVPFWTGSAWTHQQAGGTSGVNVTLRGGTGGLRGQVTVGSGAGKHLKHRSR